MDEARSEQDELDPLRTSWWHSPWFLVAMGLGPLYWLGHWGWTGQGDPALVFDMRFLLVVLVYPVLEETVFRGLLQGQLKRVEVLAAGYRGMTPANLVASIVFALCHLAIRGPAGLLVFFPSLVFGFAFDKTGSLWPCIILHVFYNAGYVVLSP